MPRSSQSRLQEEWKRIADQPLEEAIRTELHFLLTRQDTIQISGNNDLKLALRRVVDIVRERIRNAFVHMVLTPDPHNGNRSENPFQFLECLVSALIRETTVQTVRVLAKAMSALPQRDITIPPWQSKDAGDQAKSYEIMDAVENIISSLFKQRGAFYEAYQQRFGGLRLDLLFEIQKVLKADRNQSDFDRFFEILELIQIKTHEGLIVLAEKVKRALKQKKPKARHEALLSVFDPNHLLSSLPSGFSMTHLKILLIYAEGSQRSHTSQNGRLAVPRIPSFRYRQHLKEERRG